MRVYTYVIYSQLKAEYEYMATLFDQQGATKAAKNPVFFAVMTFNRDTQPIFDLVYFLLWFSLDSSQSLT